MKKNLFYLPLFLLVILPLSLPAQINPFPKKEKKPGRSIESHKLEVIKHNSIKQDTSGLRSLTFPSDSRFKTKVKKSSKGNILSIEGNPQKRKANFGSKEETMQSCFDYLNDISGTTGIKDPSSQFDIITIQDEASGHKHIKLQQKFLGIPIYGAEIIIHFKDDEPYLLNGKFHSETGLKNVGPTYGSAYAISTTLSDLGSVTTLQEFSTQQRELLDYYAPGSELVIYKSEDGKFNLAWHISIRPNVLEIWDYFIDANKGEIILKYNHTCSGSPATTTSVDLNGISRTINSWLISSTYYMINTTKSMFSLPNSVMPDNPAGAIWTLDAGNTDLANVNQITNSTNTWSAAATSAHYNAGVCFDYYKNVHNRNSLDGQGGTIISVINVTENGQGMDNAYWNGKFMAYGNGYQAFKPLAGGLDVAAHEMTHGVISHSANLDYINESGAINESMADIFGCMVDSSNWQIGESVVNTSFFPSGALRDLSDPHNAGTSTDYFWQPRIYSEFVYTSSDNGGVHTNSGIPNYAYYLFATGIGMTKYKAQKIYYLALDKYLVRSSQFIDLRIAIIAAATQLYGAGSAEVTAAGAAFDAVEIYNGSGGNYQQNLPAVSGQEYLLFTNTYITDPNSLYIYNFANSTYTPISTTPLLEKPSITDDGSIAYFVDTLGNIKSITLDPLNPVETLVNNVLPWQHVAISKDGSKLAATTMLQDTSIYIYDFNSSTWHRFYLYNPTFSTGITTDGPIYADVVEWDYSGEHLIYDCYNKVTNGSSKIDYWDIGFIKVWDNTTDSAGNGNIQKLFSELNSGVNVGNPTFSKNSPYIIAFDYLDFSSSVEAILGSNTQTGSTDLITYTNDLGFPTYSKNDDVLAYSDYDGNSENIYLILLNTDKISSPSSSGTGFLGYSSLPVLYVTGSRTTGTVNSQKSTIKLSMFPNPTEDRITLKYEIINNSDVDISITNSLGQPIKKLVSENQVQGSYNYDFSLDGISDGTYILKVTTGGESNAYKIVKIK